jgi:hypothetical protein
MAIKVPNIESSRYRYVKDAKKTKILKLKKSSTLLFAMRLSSFVAFRTNTVARTQIKPTNWGLIILAKGYSLFGSLEFPKSNAMNTVVIVAETIKLVFPTLRIRIEIKYIHKVNKTIVDAKYAPNISFGNNNLNTIL